MTEGLQSAEVNARRRFAAFISYAHADAFIAAKLQARLERYRLPKHLAQSYTGGQAALGQIFRDREDLAAAPSLSDAIRAAISEAEALIVICSPDAVASRWVGEEIALFRSLHPDRPILAAIVRGAPTEAFPAALTEGGNEPLAADLRKEADGPSLGFLKIVAGIAGVPLDALVQRDAQRRIRRVMWITGAAFAAMLIMGIMTTLALSARNEAARQRASAEGMVEYMLTDLRDRLKGVGRLDVMAAVNKRAMDYYGGETVKGQLLKARILHAMGEDDESRGNVDAAIKKFAEAARTTQILLDNEPADTERIFVHAQSEYWIGEASLRQNRFSDAGDKFRSYKAMTEKLVNADPKNPDWLREDGYANGNLCTFALSAPEVRLDPLKFCQNALSQMQAVLKLNPDDMAARKDVANRWAWLADAWKAKGTLPKAVAARLAQEDIVLNLRREFPKNMEIEEIWMKTEMMVAQILGQSGDLDKSMDRLKNARISHGILTRHDPSNAQWRNWGIEIEKMAKAKQF